MPLNINLQQILLHWMNLSILTGVLYFLLFKPVKQFMDKRAAYYQQLEEQASDKLAQAEALKAQAQAKQIVAHAQVEAEHSRERVLRDSQRELRKLAFQATKKLAFQADPFDQFLDLAEEGEEYEE